MNSKPETRNPKLQTAFTLVELLVVIAVIAILAGLLFTGMPAISRARAMSIARAEMTQIATAIEAYKAKYGFYPPDSPTNATPRNPLYYELVGMLQEGNDYKTLDRLYTISQANLTNALKVSGIVNSATSAAGTDDRPAIESFLKEFKPGQIGTNGGVRVLTSTVEDGLIWQYRSSNPTNNARSYDLWVSFDAGNKKILIANWVSTQ